MGICDKGDWEVSHISTHFSKFAVRIIAFPVPFYGLLLYDFTAQE
jgi:hypothetical protein